MSGLFLTSTFLGRGQIPGSADFSLDIVPGEGEVHFDGETPALGTIDTGQLTLASEGFPRYAPLTLTVKGVDLRFSVQLARVLAVDVMARRRSLLKLRCTGLLRPYRHSLSVRSEDRRVRLTTEPASGADCATDLDMFVVKGEVVPGLGTDLSTVSTTPEVRRVEHGRLYLRRAGDGELVLRLHGAHIDLGFTGGRLAGIGVHDSRGAVASLVVLGHSGAGVALSAALLDHLP